MTSWGDDFWKVLLVVGRVLRIADGQPSWGDVFWGVLLVVGVGITAIIFAPGWFWEWALERSAQQEQTSTAALTGEASNELHRWLSNLSEGDSSV